MLKQAKYVKGPAPVDLYWKKASACRFAVALGSGIGMLPG